MNPRNVEYMDLDRAAIAAIVLAAFEAVDSPLPLLLMHRSRMHSLATSLCGLTHDSDSVTMPPPELPLELHLMIAHQMRDDDGKLRYGDFNSFLQVNRALYACLNRKLWKEAVEHEAGTQRVFTHLIKANDLAGIVFFLKLGADIEVRLPAFKLTNLDHDNLDEILDEIEPTPLLVAADLDNVPLARLLLEQGAKVQYSGQYGGEFSPMHAARSAEMVQLLLDHNTDPNWEDDRGRRPLHWYAIRDDISAMRAILQHGVEVNGIGSHEGPLHQSARRNLDAVELLVQYGADVEETDSDASTPLHYAAKAGKIDVVKFLVQLWPEGVREQGNHSDTPLHLATQTGKIDLVKFLVERWPEGTRVTNRDRQTPLHLAAGARFGNADLVRLLVEQWPEGVRERDTWLNTPLHWAARSGWRTEDVEILVERWPEAMREKNQFGNTPLHLAATDGNAEIVRFLVKRWPEGKKVLNNDGMTPLSMYETHSKAELVNLLGGV
jgi:ankyrin repeat protein